jgi:ABC-type Fe3+/spermidine/putrescine transport system ATPase subunit
VRLYTRRLTAADSSAAATEAIVLESVTKRFDEVIAVNEVSFEIHEGEFFSMLGPSGCGKTTTLRMIAGFEEPSSGRILLRGGDVTHVPPAKRHVNMVFQSYALFPHMNVFENVAFGLRVKRVGRDDLSTRVTQAMRSVRLEGMEERRPGQLSGGQQQRVAVARAVAGKPLVILADEPTGNLDSANGAAVMSLLGELHAGGATLVVVTHDPRYLREAQRSIYLFDGRVVPAARHDREVA